MSVLHEEIRYYSIDTTVYANTTLHEQKCLLSLAMKASINSSIMSKRTGLRLFERETF